MRTGSSTGRGAWSAIHSTVAADGVDCRGYGANGPARCTTAGCQRLFRRAAAKWSLMSCPFASPGLRVRGSASRRALGIVCAFVTCGASPPVFADAAQAARSGMTAPAPAERTWVLPPSAGPQIESLTREPFPAPCGKFLADVQIDGSGATLKFGSDVSFGLRLTRAPQEPAAGSGTRTRYFAIDLASGSCPAAPLAVAAALRARETADPFVLVSTHTSTAPTLRSVLLDPQHATTATDVLLAALLLFTLLVLVPVDALYAVRALQPDRRTAIGLIIALLVAILWRWSLPFAISNWNVILSETGRYHGVARGVTAILASLHALDLPPSACWRAVVALTSVLVLPLAWIVARRLEPDNAWRGVGLILPFVLALWPRFAGIGASESPHVVACCLWSWGLVHATQRNFSAWRVLGWMLAAAAMMLCRVDAAIWTLAWLFFLPRADLAKRVVVGGLIAAVALVVLASRDVHTASLRWPSWLAAAQPWGVTTLGVVAVVGLVAVGCWSLARTNRSLLLRLTGAIAVVVVAVTEGWGNADTSVSVRYVLVIAVPLAWLSATALQWAWSARAGSPAQRVAAVGIAVLTVTAFAADAVTLHAADRRLGFQAEYTFFREALRHLPRGSRVCELDELAWAYGPNIRDFDASFAFSPEHTWYEPFDAEIINWGEVPPLGAACTHWMEPLLCAAPLALFGPVEAAAVSRFQQACREGHARFAGQPIATAQVPSVYLLHERARLGAVPVGLYQVPATHHAPDISDLRGPDGPPEPPDPRPTGTPTAR